MVKVFGVAVSAYGWISIIVAVYFNWKLAVSAGFVTWLFFGQIIPTLQGLAWPYYLYQAIAERNDEKRPSNNLINGSDQFLEDKRNFNESFSLKNQAFSLFPQTESNVPITISKEVQKTMIALLELSLEKASLVSEETLRRLHKDMPFDFREEYQMSLVLHISSMRKDSEQATKDGINAYLLSERFGNWYTNVFKK